MGVRERTAWGYGHRREGRKPKGTKQVGPGINMPFEVCDLCWVLGVDPKSMGGRGAPR